MGTLRLLLVLPLAATAFAQTKSGCSLLTLTEVTAALGPGTQQRDASSICIFTSKTTTLTVSLDANASVPFQAMKITGAQNGQIVKDEPGIGAMAYSVSPKDGHGFTIFILKGTWGSAVSADAGPVKISDLVRQKVRDLAKKAAARL